MVKIAKFTNQNVIGELNEVVVVATPKSSPEKLSLWWRNETDRLYKEYLNSDEYLLEKAEAKKVQLQKETDLRESLKVSPLQMTIVNKEQWNKFKNSDIASFVELCARLMEGRIKDGDTLENCAEKTITLLPYTLAKADLSILSVS